MSDDEDDGVERHARRTDPDTSHIAARLVKMNEQCHKILGSYYRHRHEMIDHEAYIYAGIPQSGWAHQRCSDLRDAGWIVWTGNKGVTPSNKPARKSIITDSGVRAFESWAIIWGEH